MSRKEVAVVDVAGHAQLRDGLFLQLVQATPHLRGSGAEKWALYDTLPDDGEWYDTRVADAVGRGAVRSLEDDLEAYADLVAEYHRLHVQAPKHDELQRKVCSYLTFCIEVLADAIQRTQAEVDSDSA